jgi:NADH dehydrogenase (ubiquinone) 1 alpha subcomplex subunit 9
MLVFRASRRATSSPLAAKPLSLLRSPQSAASSHFFSSSSSSSADNLVPQSAHPVPLHRRVRNAGQHGVSGVVATVFGATGFLGKFVVSVLGNVGSQTIVPYRGDGMNARHLKLAGDVGQVVPVPYDLKDEDSIRRAVKRSNVVINLIGSKYESNNFKYHDVNVKIAHRLAKISKEMGVERFIHVSSLGASPTSLSEYQRTKFEGEQVVRDQFPNATILRPAYMVGENDQFTTKFAKKASRDRQLTVTLPNVNAKIQPVYAHDVANAVFNSITYSKAQGQTYEVAGSEQMTMGDMIGMINMELGSKLITVVQPPVPVEAYAKMMWWVQYLPKRNRYGFYTSDEALKLSEDNIPAVREMKQLEDLGIEPAGFHRAMRESTMHYKKKLHPGTLGMRDDLMEPKVY